MIALVLVGICIAVNAKKRHWSPLRRHLHLLLLLLPPLRIQRTTLCLSSCNMSLTRELDSTVRDGKFSIVQPEFELAVVILMQLIGMVGPAFRV